MLHAARHSRAALTWHLFAIINMGKFSYCPIKNSSNSRISTFSLKIEPSKAIHTSMKIIFCISVYATLQGRDIQTYSISVLGGRVLASLA